MGTGSANNAVGGGDELYSAISSNNSSTSVTNDLTSLSDILGTSGDTLARYAAENAAPIKADIERVEALGVRCIAGDFASEGGVVRHAAGRVTGALLALGRAHVAARR